MTFFVYAHLRPDLTPFYIGKGTSSRARNLKPRNAHHRNVVAKCGKENVLIEMMPCRSEEEAFFREQIVIKALLAAGAVLTNKTNGGEGVSGLVHSEEVRAKISEAGKGRRVSQETRQRISDRVTGKRLTQKHKDKLALAWKSRAPMSEATKAKIAAGQKLRPPPSEEVRAKISAANSGKKRTQQQIDRLVAARSGKPLTVEHRANIAKALLGRAIPPEHREKSRIAALADWKKRKGLTDGR